MGAAERINIDDVTPVAIRLAWQGGRLEWKLHETQARIYAAFARTEARKFVLNCSRRLGKSYLLSVLACEAALRTPNAQIRYAAPTAKMVRTIVTPLMREILADCPTDLRPAFHVQDGIWRFLNGSEIHVAGCDNGGAERLRGVSTDLALIDEAGFIDDLEYLVADVLMPQTITTGGRLLLASTPPRTPDHDFRRYAEAAEAEGAYVHATIFENPMLTPVLVDEYAAEAGGVETSTFRREYLAEFVVDEETAVIPEFGRAEPHIVVRERERPKYFDAYVALDIGFLDLSVALFAYWDFKAAQLVIEDEVAINRMTTADLAEALAARERALWGEKKPHLRVSDTDLIVIADLSRLHGLKFIPTAKDDKTAAVNAVRLAIARHEIAIHERCKTLIAHLRHAVWNKARTSYERSADHGHFDAVDSLVYLVRNVARNRNPYPALADDVRNDTHFVPPEARKTDADRALERVFVGRLRNVRRP